MAKLMDRCALITLEDGKRISVDTQFPIIWDVWPHDIPGLPSYTFTIQPRRAIASAARHPTGPAPTITTVRGVSYMRTRVLPTRVCCIRTRSRKMQGMRNVTSGAERQEGSESDGHVSLTSSLIQQRGVTHSPVFLYSSLGLASSPINGDGGGGAKVASCGRSYLLSDCRHIVRHFDIEACRITIHQRLMTCPNH